MSNEWPKSIGPIFFTGLNTFVDSLPLGSSHDVIDKAILVTLQTGPSENNIKFDCGLIEMLTHFCSLLLNTAASETKTASGTIYDDVVLAARYHDDKSVEFTLQNGQKTKKFSLSECLLSTLELLAQETNIAIAEERCRASVFGGPRVSIAFGQSGFDIGKDAVLPPLR